MSLRIYGATSGYIELDAPAVGNSASVTLPTTSGVLATQIGYQLVQKIYYTTVGTSIFTKASYPWLRAINVRVQGGGGGGGAGSTNNVHGGGGGGGGYVERFITDITSIPVSASVVVGNGGNGGSGSSGANGANGGNSSFISTIVGNGGGGGSNLGGQNGSGSGGDIVFSGGDGQSPGVSGVSQWVTGGHGGSSYLGGGGRGGWQVNNALSNPNPGTIYGGGGGGGPMKTDAYANGAAGAQGLVILELYA